MRRKHEFEDTFDKLYKRSLKNRIRVVFINEYNMVETGIDAGGLTKELLTRVFKYYITYTELLSILNLGCLYKTIKNN